MDNDKNSSTCGKCGGTAGCTYGLALIGAALYYIHHATSFWAGALGILKAVVWPAMVIYKLMELLGM